MIRLLIASMSSGSGKTILTCALLEALRRRGRKIRAFKCGPDYIDPMFHRVIKGVESRNLDLFLTNPDRLRLIYADAVRESGADAAVCEGAMGFYDGVGGVTDSASAWDVARTLRLPVLLTAGSRGTSLTLAARIRGLMDFRPDNNIIGIFLNPCSPDLYKILAPMLERETGLPVLGFLPRMEEADLRSRHLGLEAPMDETEIKITREKFQILADALEKYTDLERLFALCGQDGPDLRAAPPCDHGSHSRNDNNYNDPVKIAVARDRAFCFVYPETLEIFRRYGAEIVFFSPMEDKNLPPDIQGLYLPGGYPECHARELSGNLTMRAHIARAVQNGMPVIAEGGGFLYLGQTVRNQSGERYPMAGVLPGDAFPAGRLVRFGYAHMTARSDSLLFRAGERIPVHEFHHWDSTENGHDFILEKPVSGRAWRGGFAGANLYAAFPHLYFAGRPELAEYFITAAKKAP